MASKKKSAAKKAAPKKKASAKKAAPKKKAASKRKKSAPKKAGVRDTWRVICAKDGELKTGLSMTAAEALRDKHRRENPGHKVTYTNTQRG